MNIFQPKRHHQPTIVAGLYINFISSFIQWSYMRIISFAYSWIFMKTLVMKEKILEKLSDVHIK